jgi:lipopolysaccharide biosynthesis protein
MKDRHLSISLAHHQCSGDRVFANRWFRVVSYTSAQKHNSLFPTADLTPNTQIQSAVKLPPLATHTENKSTSKVLKGVP